MSALDTLLSQTIGKIERHQVRMGKEREKFLADPAKLDKYVANIAKQLSPSEVAKEKKGVEDESWVSRVDRKIPKGHPLKGFGQELQQRLRSELANPANRQYTVGTIARGITQRMLSQEDEKGESRLARAHYYKYLKGEQVKETLPMPGMPTYGEFATARKKAELAAVNAEGDDYIASIAASATGGGLALGTLGAFAGGPVGAVAGLAIGGISGAALEAVEHPFRQWIKKTEPIRKRKFGPSYTGKALAVAATYGPGLAAGIATGTLENALVKGATARAAARAALAVPTSENVVAAAKVGKAAQAVAEAEPVAAVRAAEISGQEIAGAAPHRTLKGSRAIAVEALGEGAEKETIYKVSRDLRKIESAEGLKLAKEHPEGVEAGIEQVLGEQEALKRFARKQIGATIESVKMEKAAAEKITIKQEQSLKKVQRWEVGPRRIGGGKEAEAQKLKWDIREAEKSISKSKAANNIVDEAAKPISSMEPEIVTGRPGELIGYYGEEALPAEEIAERGLAWKIDETKVSGKEAYTAAKDRSIGEVYNAIDDMNERMLKKYYPGVNLEPSTTEELETMLKASNDLTKKMSRKENSVMDSLIRAHDEAIEVAERIEVPKERMTKLKKIVDAEIKKDLDVKPIKSMDEFRKEGRAIAEAERAGELSAVEVYDKLKELDKRVALSTATPSDILDMKDVMAGFLRTYKGKAGIVSFFGAFGVGAEVFDLFGGTEGEPLPERYEAGIIPAGAIKGFLGALKESGHIVEGITSKTKFLLKETEFQRGLGNTAVGGPKKILRDTSKLLKNPKIFPTGQIAGPYQQFEYLFNLSEGAMNNPAVFAASYMAAEYRNIRNARAVFNNIFDASGIKNAVSRVNTAMKPVAALQRYQIGFDFYKDEIPKLEGQLRKLYKRNRGGISDGAIKDTKKKLAIARKNLKKFEPKMKEFQDTWEATVRPLAKENKSVKLFLAADDTPEFTKYPFLKELEFSRDELIAVGRYKLQMDEYLKRLVKADIPVRSGPYVHYAFHPDVKASMMANLVGEGNFPYMKNYSRSLNARPLMPDLVYATSKYIPDVEKRLQMQLWWKSGWNKVYGKLSMYPAVRKAFDQLLEGRKPFDSNIGNKVAFMYSNLETFNRLFWSLSAGLKHVVKVTNDMATRGIAETVKSLPGAAKGLSYKLLEFSPTTKKLLDKLGVKHDLLRKHAFNSIVPAMDTHYRVSQMGLSVSEDIFDKANVLFNKASHVGGIFINLAELADRGISFEAAMRMAAKKGMTAEQALYGIYDTILTNNFLGREFTPKWLRDPKMKAFMLFQTTPFKILERRAITALRSGKVIKDLSKEVYAVTRTAEGRAKLVSDITELRKYIKRGEREFKANMIIDALKKDTDFYGTPIVQQFARDLMIIGAGTYAGAAAGLELFDHFFHLPFAKKHFYKGPEEPIGEIALSPLPTAVVQSWRHYKDRDDEDDEFIGKYMLDKWLGPGGLWPTTAWKMIRISDDDIPDVYRESKFKYLFSIPATKED